MVTSLITTNPDVLLDPTKFLLNSEECQPPPTFCQSWKGRGEGRKLEEYVKYTYVAAQPRMTHSWKHFSRCVNNHRDKDINLVNITSLFKMIFGIKL